MIRDIATLLGFTINGRMRDILALYMFSPAICPTKLLRSGSATGRVAPEATMRKRNSQFW